MPLFSRAPCTHACRRGACSIRDTIWPSEPICERLPQSSPCNMPLHRSAWRPLVPLVRFASSCAPARPSCPDVASPLLLSSIMACCHFACSVAGLATILEENASDYGDYRGDADADDNDNDHRGNDRRSLGTLTSYSSFDPTCLPPQARWGDLSCLHCHDRPHYARSTSPT